MAVIKRNFGLPMNYGRAYLVETERPMVEALLTGMWNGDIVANDEAPEQGMPRAKANPARLGGLQASMVDIRRAYEEANLQPLVKALLRCRYGDGMTLAEASERCSVPRKVGTELIEAGVSAIEAAINGIEQEDEDGEG